MDLHSYGCTQAATTVDCKPVLSLECFVVNNEWNEWNFNAAHHTM